MRSVKLLLLPLVLSFSLFFVACSDPEVPRKDDSIQSFPIKIHEKVWSYEESRNVYIVPIDGHYYYVTGVREGICIGPEVPAEVVEKMVK